MTHLSDLLKQKLHHRRQSVAVRADAAALRAASTPIIDALVLSKKSGMNDAQAVAEAVRRFSSIRGTMPVNSARISTSTPQNLRRNRFSETPLSVVMDAASQGTLPPKIREAATVELRARGYVMENGALKKSGTKGETLSREDFRKLTPAERLKFTKRGGHVI